MGAVWFVVRALGGEEQQEHSCNNYEQRATMSGDTKAIFIPNRFMILCVFPSLTGNLAISLRLIVVQWLKPMTRAAYMVTRLHPYSALQIDGY